MARHKVPTNPIERRAWIKYMLELNGTSMSKIAREGGVTKQVVRRALEIKYPKWDKAIADKIGFTPAEIWPERYTV